MNDLIERLREEVQLQCEDLRCEAEGNREAWEKDYPHVTQMMLEAADLIERLARENERITQLCITYQERRRQAEHQRDEALRALEDAAKGGESIAFEIPPPNEYTPRFVMWANQMRNKAARIRAMKEDNWGESR